MNYNNYAVDSASFWTKNKRVNLNETIDFTVLGRDNTLNLKETLVLLKDFFESPVLKENYEYDTIDDFNDSALKVSIDWDGAQILERLSFPISFNLKEKIAACVIIGENLNINNFVYGDEAFSPMSKFIKERFIAFFLFYKKKVKLLSYEEYIGKKINKLTIYFFGKSFPLVITQFLGYIQTGI